MHLLYTPGVRRVRPVTPVETFVDVEDKKDGRPSELKGNRGRRPFSRLPMLLLGATIFFAAFCIITYSVTGGGPERTNRILQALAARQHRTPGTATEDSSSTSSNQPGISNSTHDSTSITVTSTTSSSNIGKSFPASTRSFHTVTTTQGFANHWQARIHYYWFLKQRTACHEQGVCDMGGFTRLLHSGEADDLLDEIPSVVVDHLPASVLKESSYVVLNRPFAFMEWLQKVSIPERYVLMAEADHLFLRPLPNLMAGEAGGAALFTYIVPEQYPDIVRKFTGPISDDEIKMVPKIGNSPTMMSVVQLRKLAPAWYNTTIAIFEDAEANKAWNWVLEMYGFSLATYNLGFHKGMSVLSNFLAHPPYDKTADDYQGNPYYILHLTYPCSYDKDGNITSNEGDSIVWQFEKRKYGDKPPPLNLDYPPENVKNELVRTIISMINEATANIPCWAEYYETKKVLTDCPSRAIAGVAKSIA